MYVARFDYRSPGATNTERSRLYRESLEMARWVDERGCMSLVVSEHHSTADGYLPSPLQVAAAMAAVTERTQITVAVAVLPFYDPIRLAEDLITLDHLSAGRVMVVLGLGYRETEYDLYGVDFGSRGRIADQKLEALLAHLDASRRAELLPRVTPTPFSEPRPLLAWGGKSKAAARRAGRFGLGFYAQTNTPGLREAFRGAAESSGQKPGFCFLPPPDAPYAVFVNDDVDMGWNDVGQALLNDASGYQEWNDDITEIASFSSSVTVDALRDEQGAHRVVSSQGVGELLSEHGFVSLHPLCGGLAPDTAWPYLRRAVGVLNP